MARRHLIIEQPAAQGQKTPTCISVEVSDEMSLESLVVTLAARLGYPLIDHFGSPIPYRLRSRTCGELLPATGRFAQAHFRSGSHFVLEARIANHEIMPLQSTSGRATVAQHASVLPPPCSRRSVLTVGVSLTLASLLGLSTGVVTALAHRVLSGQAPSASASSTEPPGTGSLRLSTQAVFPEQQQTVQTVAWSPDETLFAGGGDDTLLIFI